MEPLTVDLRDIPAGSWWVLISGGSVGEPYALPLAFFETLPRDYRRHFTRRGVWLFDALEGRVFPIFQKTDPAQTYMVFPVAVEAQ